MEKQGMKTPVVQRCRHKDAEAVKLYAYWTLNGTLSSEEVKQFFQKHWGMLSRVDVDFERGQMTVHKRIERPEQALKLFDATVTRKYAAQPWWKSVNFDATGLVEEGGSEWYCEEGSDIEGHLPDEDAKSKWRARPACDCLVKALAAKSRGK